MLADSHGLNQLLTDLTSSRWSIYDRVSVSHLLLLLLHGDTMHPYTVLN
jgi:hypothetical protein